MKKIFNIILIVMVGVMPVLTSCDDIVIGTVDNPSPTPPTVVHISGISITGEGIADNSVKMNVGGTLQLSAVITPSDTEETGVKWTSSDGSILTVSV